MPSHERPLLDSQPPPPANETYFQGRQKIHHLFLRRQIHLHHPSLRPKCDGIRVVGLPDLALNVCVRIGRAVPLRAPRKQVALRRVPHL